MGREKDTTEKLAVLALCHEKASAKLFDAKERYRKLGEPTSWRRQRQRLLLTHEIEKWEAKLAFIERQQDACYVG